MVPKKELKVAASVDTSKLAAKMILIKTKTYDLDSNKLKNVPAHQEKLYEVADKSVLKKVEYNNLNSKGTQLRKKFLTHLL